MFPYPADHPILRRALEIERKPDIEAIDGAYRSRQAALYIAMAEAAGMDSDAVTVSGRTSEFLPHYVIEELRKAVGLDYVTMANFCAESFRDKREGRK